MKKTERKATIGQLNRMTGNYTHIDRRVFEDENGNEFVKVNGSWIDLDQYDNDINYKVQCYWVGK